jgi:transposase-like protein
MKETFRYPESKRIEAIQRMEEGEGIVRVSKNMEIPPMTIYRWIRRYKRNKEPESLDKELYETISEAKQILKEISVIKEQIAKKEERESIIRKEKSELILKQEEKINYLTGLVKTRLLDKIFELL